jgi:DUF4097 and DUF4098 domain-containing protein YvlB
MNGIVIGAMMALSLVQQTDTTFAVGTATRLDVENDGGQIVVAVWDRDEIRIQAEHSRRSIIEIDRSRSEIQIEADAVRGGMSGIVDYTITVPRGFDLKIEGMYTDISIDGADGMVEAETMQGDILIRGGRGEIHASSTTGRIRVEGAQGRIDVESVAEEIRISNSSGEIIAESVGGSIIMENINASSVDAGTVGGRVVYMGTIEADGMYFFGSHGGSISLVIPADSDVEVSLASLHGSISADIQGAPGRFERGKRTTFTMGSGRAIIEAETFGGRIMIREQGGSGNFREVR